MPAKAAIAALRSVPGPTPWYAKAALRRNGAALSWDEPEGEGLSGITYLKMASDVLAIFDFHCYISPLEGSRFLVWHAAKTAGVSFRLFDADRLEVISDPVAAAVEMRKAREAMAWRGGLTAETIVPTDLEDGAQTWHFPEGLATLDEIFALAGSTAYGRTSNGFDKNNLVLWHVQPRCSRIDIFPQDWFNEGPYDFVWQGPWIVAREPESGEIVGCGTRIGIFVLDDSRRAVRSWLSDPSKTPVLRGNTHS